VSGLQPVDDDGARCAHCGRPAAGPCASCRRPVCGDCCTLTEGGVRVWAICLDCERRGGRTMRSAWFGLLGWVALVVLGLGGLVALLLFLGR
jgi:hypothetical protein